MVVLNWYNWSKRIIWDIKKPLQTKDADPDIESDVFYFCDNDKKVI